MPTLREFVDDVLAENNIQSDPEQIIRQITDIARTRAVNNVAAISDIEIREMVINNAELANRLAQEKKAREEAREAEKKAEMVKKQLEKERKTADGEQMVLF